MKKIISIAVFLFWMSVSYSQKTLTPSDEGSKVHFVIKNLGFKVGGDFTGLKGMIKFDPNNAATWFFDVSVDAYTIDTDNGSRDGHLKKPEYFDVKNYPVIKLLSTKITSDKPGIYTFNGNLTIKGITKPVKFTFKVNALNGGYLFTGGFDLNRRDFNVGSDSISLSDSLRVSLSVFAK